MPKNQRTAARLLPSALALSVLPLTWSAIPALALGPADYALFSPQDISLGQSNSITGVIASNSNMTLSTFTSITAVAGAGTLSTGAITVTGDVTFNGNINIGSSSVIGGTIYSGGNVDLGFAQTQSHGIVATGNVSQGQSALTTGDIHAGGSFSNQNFSNVIGNVFANSAATVNGTVTGNVTHGGQLTIGPFGSVTGSTPTGTTPANPLHYAPLSLPGAISFSSGGANVTSGGTVQSPLAPGSYGDLTISTFGKLYLTAGDYYFNSFTFNGDSIRLLNLTPSSHIRIFVTGDVSESTFSQMFVNEVPFASANSTLASNVLLETLGNYSQNTGSVQFFGTLFAPGGSVTLGSYSSLTGSIIAGGKVTSSSGFSAQFVKSALLPGSATPATWDGSVGLWSDAARWSSNPNVPENGTPAGAAYDVTINGGTITLDVPAKINSISLGKTAGAFTEKLNLSANKLIIQASDTADKSAKIISLAAALASGANAGTWDGPGINSSDAASDKTHYAVGLFDNAVLGKSQIAGQSVDSNSLLVSIAHLGDANDSGIVDIQDQSLITNHWQTAQTHWTAGDLNLDGFVDLQDLTLVTNNWQQSSTFTLSPGQLVTSSQPIPEPTSMLLTLPAFLLLRRRIPRSLAIR